MGERPGLRYGVVLPPDSVLRAWQRDCLARLEDGGHGRPAWAVAARSRVTARIAALLDREGPAATLPPGTSSRPSPVDFVVSFAEADHAGAIREAEPRFGVWRCALSLHRSACLRALSRAQPSVAIALWAESVPEHGSVLLQHGVVPLADTWREAKEKIASVIGRWPARVAAEIASGSWPPARHGSAPDTREARPRLRAFLRLPIVPLARALRAWRGWTTYETWNVGIVELSAPPSDLRDLARTKESGGVRWLPERDELFYYADPFPYRRGERDGLLVEAYGHPQGAKGEVFWVDLDATFHEGADVAEPAIVRTTHLSYPHLFHDGERLYCTPEMHQEDGCILYGIGADGRWRPVHHILRGTKVVDPTFFRHQGRVWLFCTDMEGGGSFALHAFHAEAIGGPWTPHALNPLRCDLASARPAGPVFELDGRLYRPAQDSTHTYGGSLKIMEIDELTPERFRERLALHLAPDPHGPYPDGMHHIVCDGRRLVFDAKRLTYDPLLWFKNRRLLKTRRRARRTAAPGATP